MTLEEAIKHCEEKSCGQGQCAFEHKQLTEWLKELQLLKASPSNLDEAAEMYQLEARKHVLDNSSIGTAKDAFKAGAEWMAAQGITFEDTISAHKTFPVLCEKEVSEFGLDYGDEVIVQIRKK